MVEALQPERDLSRHPLFQVMFVLENDAWRFEADLDEIKLRQLVTESGLSTFDLTLAITSNGFGEVEYNTDLFEADTIRRMLEHWQVLLEGIVAHAELPIAELPLLTPGELRQLLVDWNATGTAFPGPLCFHEIFESQAQQHPEAIAVVYGEMACTYQEINARANQLAHHLQHLGIGPDTLVGLCVERSMEMIIGLLGILKAGAAYLPLDPTYPQSRLELMLQKETLLLTQQDLQAKFPGSQAIICLDADWTMLAQQSSENPESRASIDSLAYVIYTSGSTGHPKGVQLTHRGIQNLVAAQTQAFSLHRGERVLQFASLSFDASVFEIAMALLTGATLLLERRENLLPGPGLLQVLRELAITIVTLPPSALMHLPVAPLPSLETIIVAGEACPAELVARWAPGRRFFNAYGPTEATIWSSVARCRAEDRQKPCIGRPISNTELYVLDRYLQPVPSGVPGELYIGSIGLARGYLRQPDLTAERFIPHPFVGTFFADQLSAPTMNRGATGHDSGVVDRNFKQRFSASEPGERLYRTGDMVRYRPDGSLEFLGRQDHQVKIRGYRIELEELEHTLRQHLAVREAVVLVQATPSGNGDSRSDMQLVAYVVPVEADLSVSELRSYLREKLPAYMVPASFVLLTALPLSSNGKVNRKALAQQKNEQHSSELETPQNEVERELLHIWQKVLQVSYVGLNDNFFDVGGHSFRLVQMQSELQKVFKREIPIVDLFVHTTIRSLASYISQGQEEEALSLPGNERVHRHHSSTQRQRNIRQLHTQESSR